jgi:hypothetical protein
MTTEPIIKPLRLIFQGSVTVENAEDADIIYDQLKTFVKCYGRDCTLNGQIMKMLEPCCPPPARPRPSAKNETSPAGGEAGKEKKP